MMAHATNDGCPSTSAAFGADGRNVTAMTFGDPLHGLVLFRQGVVFRTTDGGTTWTPVGL
jgi:photosystem II stability/assembly factor-like uncharacterized protein